MLVYALRSVALVGRSAGVIFPDLHLFLLGKIQGLNPWVIVGTATEPATWNQPDAQRLVANLAPAGADQGASAKAGLVRYLVLPENFTTRARGSLVLCCARFVFCVLTRHCVVPVTEWCVLLGLGGRLSWMVLNQHQLSKTASPFCILALLHHLPFCCTQPADLQTLRVCLTAM
jgi:hypothetical protein